MGPLCRLSVSHGPALTVRSLLGRWSFSEASTWPEPQFWPEPEGPRVTFRFLDDASQSVAPLDSRATESDFGGKVSIVSQPGSSVILENIVSRI